MSNNGFSHTIIDIANDFYEAYKRCGEGKNQRQDEYGRIVADVVNVPTIVNGVFACELYLKSLLPENKRRKFGHNIKLIFEKLNLPLQKTMQDEIIANIDWEYNSFDVCLDCLSNDFQFWRYIHESEDFGPLGLNGTLRVLPAFLETFKKYATTEITDNKSN